jgi:A/G-specific adenine glycosylase
MKRIAPAADVSAEGGDPGFAAAVVAWQKQHGRHALPWQNTRDAYRIWLSEIMLQQTQVSAVIPYYQRFLARFPDVAALAAAPSEEVMSHWSGLGYYSRARNLHRCAQRVCEEFGGVFPADPEQLAELPGIGRSTAAAISAFAYGTRAAILDGNVKRVFCRVFGIEGFPGVKPVEDALWRRAEALLPQADNQGGDMEADMQAYTQGLMDLGATVCTRGRPACERCPLAQRCIAFETGRTAELPVRKPKKAVPERHATMLVIVDDGQVLLEQRPGNGIWGGLLSLPELPGEGKDAEPDFASIVAPFGVIAAREKLQAFTHVFTHFKLHVAPWRIRLSVRRHLAGELPHVWYPVAQLARAPLPAPVKKLLLGLLAPGDLLSDLS